MNGSQSRKHLAASLYPLKGLEDRAFMFRILKIQEKIPEDNFRPIRIQRWADRMWRKVLRCPTYPSNRFGFPAFIIPAEADARVGQIIEIHDVPDTTFHIEVTDQVIEISPQKSVEFERELICRMIERPFSDRFMSLRKKYWRAEWTLFYKMLPENIGRLDDVVHAYRGLKFGVILMRDVGPHMALDLRTRFVSRKSLVEYDEASREKYLSDHLDKAIPIDKRASFIRDNGAIKITCRYAGETGKSIKDFVLEDVAGISVLEYYNKQYPDLILDPNESAVFVQDKDFPLPAPSSRLYPVFTTEFEGIRNCSVRPQMTPMERANVIESFLEDISNVNYGSERISVDRKYLTRGRSVFSPPSLEYGKGEVLQPFPKGVPDQTQPPFDKLILKWSSQKMPFLYRVGPFYNEPLPETVVFFPNSITRSEREVFVQELNAEVFRQTKNSMQIVQQRPYKVGQDELRGRSLLRLVAEIDAAQKRYLLVVILWDRFEANVHGDLKEIASRMMSQCVTEKTVRNIVRNVNPSRGTNQLRNLALGVLTEIGTKPWVLGEPLHSDLFIGIDLLYGRVGYHYLYGTGGRKAFRRMGRSVVRGRMREAIKRPEIKAQIVDGISQISDSGIPIRNFVIHRDGRWWPSERAGLAEAVDELKAIGKLSKDVDYTVIEVRKNHFPVRLFTQVEENNRAFLQNPLPGTFLELDDTKTILCTTGRPGAWDSDRGRTAGTLLLQVAEHHGDVRMVHLAEDIYRLTHLNWNSPDIEIGLPVTIRWNDEALRESLVSHADEDNLVEQLVDEEAEEDNSAGEEE